MASYNKLSPAAAERLRAVVGDGRFQYGESVREEYSHDEMPIYGRYLPEAVCLAESTEEVSEILKLCHEENVPVTVRGAGFAPRWSCPASRSAARRPALR